ncbi:hypothetical protein [Pseudomonas sp.]|uniref:hypothetical protein n=1 Tax=Pseudomonas sp. TaxID=306 RepID=UPI003F36275B
MPGEIDWTPLVQSLAAINWTAVLVGGVTGAGPFLLWKKQVKKEAESVRASLLAEVAALVEIVERRGYLPGLREREALLRARSSSAYAIFPNAKTIEPFVVHIDSQYSRVYQGNVSKLGVLTAEDAKQIVRFHQLADSVRLDVVPGGVLTKSSNPQAFKETGDLLEMAMKIGRDLTEPKPVPTPKWWKFWVPRI